MSPQIKHTITSAQIEKSNLGTRTLEVMDFLHKQVPDFAQVVSVDTKYEVFERQVTGFLRSVL